MQSRTLVLGALAATASLAAACGGGGGSTGTPSFGAPSAPTVPATSAPTQVPVSTQQVVSMALPSSAIGVENDPVFGTVAGYTQQQFSQVLGFAPGAQIMVRNAGASAPHTLSFVSSSGFTQNPSLSVSPAGGSTIGAGFSTGSVAPGALAGPFTLASGTYWLGCAFHYASNGMRTVLVVAANATPGPQATANPASTPPPSGGNYGGG